MQLSCNNKNVLYLWEKRILIAFEDINFSYPNGPHFEFPDITLRDREHLLISGESGIGKTTLLYIMGLLLKPEQGKLAIDNTELHLLNKSQQDAFRGKHIGFVFQSPHFIKSLNVIEQLTTKLYFSKSAINPKKTDGLLDALGILDLKYKKVNELSEGQKQRLSIAIALANNPKLILADEPTSSLDDTHCNQAISLLTDTANQIGAHLIVITHDQRVKPHFKNTLQL